MTSKLVVNTIEADTGISSVSFASSISLSSTSKFFFSDAGIDIGPDTNINRPATGVIGFNINSSEKLRIKADGSVGIGTDDPQQSLHILDTIPRIMLEDSDSYAGGGAYKTRWGQSGNSTLLEIDVDGTGYSPYFNFKVGGSEKLRITSSGQVGIGTSAPDGSSTLHIHGGGASDKNYIRLTADRGLIARLGDTSSGAQAMFDLYDPSDGSTQIVRLISGGGVNYINTGGNVGINTNNPTANLEVSSGVINSEKSAGWLDQYDAQGIRIFNNARSTLGIYTLEQGDWSSSTILGTIDGSVTRKWGIGMASNAKSTYASGLYIGYRTDNSSTGANTLNMMTHSLILPTTGDVRVNVGNLIIATNNKGIAFSGSTSSPDADSTSNTRLLSDYDEGTTVWELHRSDGLTTGSNHNTSKVTYTKIGNRVYMSGYVYTMSTGSSTGVTARLTDANGNAASLPYTPNHHGILPICHTRTIGEYERMSVAFSSGSKTVYVHTDEGYNSYEPNTNNVNIGNPQTHLNIAFTGSYTTDE